MEAVVPVLLIDDQGGISDKLPLSLGDGARSRARDVEPLDYAILKLGFIELMTFGDHVRVRLYPRLVSDPALATLCFWLNERAPSKVTLRWYDGCWHDHVSNWGRTGLRCVSRLFDSGTDSQRFERDAISPDALGSDNPLLRLFESWSWHPTDFDRSRDILHRLNDRFVLLEEDADHELRICQIGRTMMSRSPSWKRNAIGLRVDDLPDWRYGQWVAEAYREVARDGKPLVEKVAASIQWEERGDVMFHSYWRVILPLKERGMSTLLLGATLDCAASTPERAC